MLNKVEIMGRLTREPELKKTTSGVSLCSFAIACERNFKGRDGAKQTDFFECTAWRSTADFISKYFAKGRMAILEGQLQTEHFTDKQGNNRSTVKIVVDNAYFGDSKQSGGCNAVDVSAGDFADGPAMSEITGEGDGELPF